MKFTADLQIFQKQLTTVLPAVRNSSDVNYELTDYVLLELSGNDLVITTTDYQLWIKTSMEVLGEEDGTIYVPAKRLHDFVKVLNNSKPCVFETLPDKDDSIRITSGRTKLVIASQTNDSEWSSPPLLQPDFESNKKIVSNSITFSSDVINKLASKTVFATIKGETGRENMQGVLFQFRETFVNAVATDTKQLVRYTHYSDDIKFPENLDLLIPERVIQIFKNIDSETKISYELNNDNEPISIRFDFGNTTMISRLISMKFPNYEVIIPKTSTYTATFDITSFITGLKMVTPVVNPKDGKCSLLFRGTDLTITTSVPNSNEYGEAVVDCEFEGAEEFLIKFNIQQAIDMVSNIDSSDTTNNLVS